jgi:hypothetical protein
MLSLRPFSIPSVQHSDQAPLDQKSTLLKTIDNRSIQPEESKGAATPAVPQGILVEDLLAERHLSKTIFQDKSITLKDGTAKHAAWMFNHIYSIGYNGEKNTGIVRHYHGIQHTARAAVYVPIFVNLYKRYNDPEALALTEEDIKLLEIAALLHDSGRRAEGKDEWDKESGIFVYAYLTNVLGVEKNKAKLIAEAVTTNKEPDEENYYYSIETYPDGSYFCEKKPLTKKNIYARIIQNVDSLDIKRVRDIFKIKYLSFYQDIAKNNPKAFEELAHLIAEVKSIIISQGDTYRGGDDTLKAKFENSEAYNEIIKNIFVGDYSKHYKIIYGLYNARGLDVYKDLLGHIDPGKDISEEKLVFQEKLERLLWNGKVLARVVNPMQSVDHVGKLIETGIEFEVRKIIRRKGIATRSKKVNKTDKHGFDARSVSLIGPNAGLFNRGPAGYLIFNPEMKHIEAVSDINANTGYGKKKAYPPLDKADEKLKELTIKLKSGGAGTSDSQHTEILYRVTEANAVFFTNDSLQKNGTFFSSKVPLLQAILIQKEFKKQTGKILPIVDYSYKHNSARMVNFSDADIIDFWIKLCSEYIDKLQADELTRLNVEKIKSNVIQKSYCQNYEPELKKSIDDGVAELIVRKQIGRKEQYRKNKQLFVDDILAGNFVSVDTLESLANSFGITLSVLASMFEAKLKALVDKIDLENNAAYNDGDIAQMTYISKFALKYSGSEFNKLITTRFVALYLVSPANKDKANHPLLVQSLRGYLTKIEVGASPVIQKLIVDWLLVNIDWSKKYYNEQLDLVNYIFEIDSNKAIFDSFNQFFTPGKSLTQAQQVQYQQCLTRFKKHHLEIYKTREALFLEDLPYMHFSEYKSVDDITRVTGVSKERFVTLSEMKILSTLENMLKTTYVYIEHDISIIMTMYNLFAKYNLAMSGNKILEKILDVYLDKIKKGIFSDKLDSLIIETKLINNPAKMLSLSNHILSAIEKDSV